MAVRNTRTEVAGLRHDLATARVAMAKQEAVAIELRKEVETLRAERGDLLKMLGQTQSAMNALQNDHDPLTHANTPLPTATDQKALSQTETDAPRTPSTLRDLETRMTQLSHDFTQLELRLTKQFKLATLKVHSDTHDRVTERHRPATAQLDSMPVQAFSAIAGAPPVEESSNSSSHDLSPAVQRTLTQVQPGASLWQLAHQHGLTVDELKKANGLTTDVIRIGQQLVIPRAVASNTRR